MPIPLLFIAIGAVAGALGVGKSVKAAVDTHDAKKTNKEANEIVDSAKKMLEQHRDKCGFNLRNLGETKVYILDSSINDFVRTFGQLKNVDFKESTGLDEMHKLYIDSKDFNDLKELGNFATSMLGGVAGGAMGGALTAFGAYSAAGTFAAASTGTAIASLSGAAATNATLAFFGGGSLAAGGLGIAGGTMVLGGLVAGPALAIMGFIVGAKASKAKDEAYSNLAKAKQYSEEMAAACDLCSAISKKCVMFIKLLEKLDTYFVPVISKMKEAIDEHGTDFRLFSKEQKQATAAAASLAKAIKTVLDTPILDKDGNITSESTILLNKMNPEEIATGKASTSNTNNSYQYVNRTYSDTTKQKLEELCIKDIVARCTYDIEYKSSEYSSYDDEQEEYGDVNFQWLTKLMNYSYGLNATEEEYESVINEYNRNGENYRISDLEWHLEYFVRKCQIALIVENCIRHRTEPLNEGDVDWFKLIDKIQTFYKFKMEKWQLFTPGKNTIQNVKDRVGDVVSNYEHSYVFVKSEFQRLNRL